MNVLIVDDEIKVCKLLQNLVDWEKLGMKIIGVENDGNRALAFILEKHPDIVITDIRMPGCDGIEMIRRVREKNSNIHFIIISGYNQFEYAVSAIRYGVEDYLLKPLKQRDLERILNKIANNHRQHTNKDERDMMLKHIKTDAYQIKSHCLSEMWFHFPDKINNLALEQLGQSDSWSFPGDCFALIFIQIVCEWNKEELLISNKQISGILNDELSNVLDEILIVPVDDGILCLINASEIQLSEVGYALQRIKIRLNSYKNFVIAYSGILHGISDIYLGIDHCKKAVAQKYLINDPVITYSPTYEPLFPVSDFLPSEARDEFRLIVVSCNCEKLMHFINLLCKEMKDKKVCGYTMLQVYHEIVALFSSTASSNGIDLPEEYLVNARQDCHNCLSPEMLFNCLCKRISDILDNWKSAKNAQTSFLIRKACRYISEHYVEPISLQSISEYVGLNPSYLSSLFKREVGMTFLDYLTETRMIAAQKLLVNTDIRIDDLPDKIGYNDLKYFYKRFKKSTGVSPKEYRKLYGRF